MKNKSYALLKRTPGGGDSPAAILFLFNVLHVHVGRSRLHGGTVTVTLVTIIVKAKMAEIIVAIFHDRALRRERRYRDRLDPLALSDQELITHYRFPRHELINLIEELDPYLRKRTRRSQAIPTHTQVLMTLRILASGSFQHVMRETIGKYS